MAFTGAGGLRDRRLLAARAISIAFMRKLLILAIALSGCHQAKTAVKTPVKPAVKIDIDPDLLPFRSQAREQELQTIIEALRAAYSHIETKKTQWGTDLDLLLSRYRPIFRKAETWS